MDRVARTIIYNQLEILKQLNSANAAQYELQQKVVEAGYTSRYEEVFGSVAADEASAAMQDEVWDTLSMFRALHNLQQNGWTPSDPARAKFDGFDANNDSQYFFASHLIDDCGLFAESAPNKNSHSIASAARFRNMVTVWKAAANRHNLSTQEADSIINA